VGIAQGLAVVHSWSPSARYTQRLRLMQLLSSETHSYKRVARILGRIARPPARPAWQVAAIKTSGLANTRFCGHAKLNGCAIDLDGCRSPWIQGTDVAPFFVAMRFALRSLERIDRCYTR
jgi:hypothetical protein